MRRREFKLDYRHERADQLPLGAGDLDRQSQSESSFSVLIGCYPGKPAARSASARAVALRCIWDRMTNEYRRSRTPAYSR